jgi:hypothetical protein
MGTAISVSSSTGPAVTGVGTGAIGVFGASDTANAVVGLATAGGYGVEGTAEDAGNGVVGNANGSGNGVVGNASGSGNGLFGTAHGSGNGVSGTANGISGIAYGVYGTGAGASGTHPSQSGGVFGDSESGYGVYAASKANDGVHGISASQQHAAISGRNSGGGRAVYGQSTGDAGYFDGNITCTGNVTCNGDITCSSGKVTAKDIATTNSISAKEITVSGKVTADDVIITGGQDCAEDFDTADSQALEPGTVVVLTDDGAIHQSAFPYDRRVAGVVSGAGAFRPGLILGRASSSQGEGKAPVALVGRIYCKVDADTSPIAIGDLLTTSDTPGHAMKATDQQKSFGAVIGKALRPLERGRGLLPILVALQ